jgi:hypothetical protein
MTTKPKQQTTGCPFWLADSLKCKLCNDGLFIPFDDHIKTYCKTVHHPQCLQYTLYADAHLQLTESTETAFENRRRHPRVEVHHKITLVKSTQSGEIISHHAAIAKTLDVSRNGMRLEVDIPLMDDTVVQFSFDDSFPKALQSGLGQIKWCNKQIDESGYQAGLTLQGEQEVEAMRQYLGEA